MNTAHVVCLICIISPPKLSLSYHQHHLFHQVRNQSSLVDMILSHVCTRPEICEGVGHLMFEICRGVSQQFHSCTTSFLPLLLTKLGHGGEFTRELTALCDHPPFRAMRKMIELMAEYTKREFCEPVWGPLLVS